MHRLIAAQARVALTIAALSALLPTHAAVTTTATLSHFTWTLQDLNPEDGIPPSLAITSIGDNRAAANHYSTLFETHSNGGGGAGATGDVSATANLVAGQTAGASVTTGVVGHLPLLTLSAQGSTVASAPEHFARFDSSATSRGWAFVLSPHTQVSFSAASSLLAQMTGGAAEASFGHTSLWVALQPGSDAPSAVEDLAYVSLVTQSAPGRQRSMGSVSVVFDNPTDDSATAYLSAMAYAYGETVAAPVPEPEAWAMLLAGLGVVGVWGRQRRRAQLSCTRI